MINKIYKKVDINLLKYIAIITVLFMFITHGFCYFNILYSHDSSNIFHSGFYTDSLEIGRFIIPVWTLIRGKYYPPLLIGTFSTLFMIIIIYLVCNLFSFKGKKVVLLVAALFCTCSSLSLLNATYINYADMYLFALLLNILAVYFLRKKNKLSLIAIGILFISYGIYQAYLGITLGLCIILLIIDLVQGKNYKDIILEGIKDVCLILLSLVLYLVVNKIILLFCNFDLNDNYNSISNVGNFKNIGNLFKRIFMTYIYYFKYFLYQRSFRKYIIFGLNCVMSVIALFYLNKFVKNNKPKLINIILIILLCLLLPFAFNITYFISGSIHDLMTFFAVITYIFIIYLILNSKGKIKKLDRLMYLFFSIIIIFNVIYANQIYEKKKIEFDSTITTLNRVIMQIENIEGYQVNKTPVVIIGNLGDGPLSFKREELDYKGIGLGNTYSLTNNRNYYRFIKYYMGYPMNIVDNNMAKSVIAKKFYKKTEIKKMPCYPNDGSIQLIDGYVIVKFSELNKDLKTN